MATHHVLLIMSEAAKRLIRDGFSNKGRSDHFSIDHVVDSEDAFGRAERLAEKHAASYDAILLDLLAPHAGAFLMECLVNRIELRRIVIFSALCHLGAVTAAARAGILEYFDPSARPSDIRDAVLRVAAKNTQSMRWMGGVETREAVGNLLDEIKPWTEYNRKPRGRPRKGNG